MGIRVLFCDIDWAIDEGRSNREIVNFKPDRNKGPVRFVNWMRIPDAVSARSNWIQQSDVVRSRFWKFWIFGWACCSWKRSNISSRNPKKSGWVFKINLDAASNLTSYFAPNEHRSASASGYRVQFTKRTRPSIWGIWSYAYWSEKGTIDWRCMYEIFSTQYECNNDGWKCKTMKVVKKNQQVQYVLSVTCNIYVTLQ